MKPERGYKKVEDRGYPFILYNPAVVRPTVPKWQPEGGGHDNQSTTKKRANQQLHIGEKRAGQNLRDAYESK